MKRILPLALLALAIAAPSARSQIPADYEWHMAATPSAAIRTTLGANTYANFPVLLRLSASASAKLQTTNGTDLLVLDENNAALPFEVDTFDPSGETLVWVKVPSLSADTELTVYFGGPANAENDPTNVWSSYVGVWHFAPSEAGGTTVADAAGHGLGGTTTGTITTYAGPFGGDALQSTAKVQAPDYDSRLANVAQFSVSGWFKAPNYAGGSGKYHSFVSKKDDLNWSTDKGWYVEMSESKTKANLVLTASNTFTIPDATANWNYFHLVSDGSTVKVYMNGSTNVAKSVSYAVKASAKPFTICGTDGCSDEYRIRAGAVTAAEAALEYATMADTAFFDYGTVAPNDATAPVVGEPVVTRDAGGAFLVSAEMTVNAPTSVAYDADGVTGAMATSDAALPMTYSATISGLASDTTYLCSVKATSTGGTVTEKPGTTAFYNGDLSVEKVSDAVENGLVPGVFRVSRADTAHDLAVAYTVGGTATAGQTYTALPGTATIPAGSSSADIQVVPLLDPDTTADTTVVLTLAAGLYGIDASAASASLTITNLVAPAGFNTWISPSNSLASIDCNWSSGHSPTASEHVLFDGRFSTANCTWDENASATVASWTQTNDYTGVITLDTVYPGKGDFQCLTVTGPMAVMSGTITHPQSRTLGQSAPDYLQDLLDNETYRVRIDAGSLTIGENGRIDTRNKGYYQSSTGNITTPAPSHGGRLSASGLAPYDDVKEPIHVGLPYMSSSGGYYRGIGGGAVYLTSAGAVVVDGYIGADTGSDTWNRNLTLREGAAAGSVYVRGATVSGTGTISASALATAEQNRRGVGGRVAVIATSSTPIDYARLQLKASVYPFNNSNNPSSTYGGCGTVYVKDATMTNGVLIVRNFDLTYSDGARGRRTDVTADCDWTFDRLELGGGAQLCVPYGTTLTLPGWDCVTAPYNTSGTPSGLLYSGGTLDFGSAADIVLSGHWHFAPASNYVFNANVSLADGAGIGFGGKYTQTLSNNAYPVNLDKIHCTVNGDLTVPAGSAVNVNLAGAMQDSNGVPAGYPQGAHGGRRSNTMKTIGSVFHPRTLPHGQSNSYGHIIPGGAAELVVSGTLALDGTVTATAYTGGDGIVSQVGGGSIDISAGRLVGAGSIKAGAVKNGQPGGRIAIRLTGNGATLGDFEGTIDCATMGNGSIGSCGSIYVQTATAGEGRGTVFLDDNGVTCSTYTPICATGYEADDVADFRHADLVVRNQAKAQVAAVDANGTFTMDDIEVDETGALDLFGNRFVVTSAKIGDRNVPPGTYTAEQLQTLGIAGVVDTADGAGGTLIVRGASTLLIIK